ncbi:DNA topoisomerase 2-binding protein 1-A [Tetrabaena socialis]|uniref:DNA topoisomerase 2-binding protein 1-A n=1 Tax=Tetrabaena socialis TaxID=47790 RepID=A0A2J8A8U5_9CHLO|nr:DNA topoisomerase 2-binding protein 1-A [Tetrabaena socialis]|eukprot:PNH08930.1 DNA topoisomerase 2-binding protein 1-A [Tetrabaena socialis]
MGCLSGVRIVFGNLVDINLSTEHQPRLEDLAHIAASLGAIVLEPSEADNATYLVANSVLRTSDGDDPYLVATQRNHGLLVVKPDWLRRCQEAQCQAQPAEFRLGPFGGIKASITNFGVKERDAVVNHLKDGGAIYSPELYRATTHLVGMRGGSSKHKYAKDWGMHVVHYDWVLHSLKAGRRLCEVPYTLDVYGVPGAAAAAAAADAGITRIVAPVAGGPGANNAPRGGSLARSTSTGGCAGAAPPAAADASAAAATRGAGPPAPLPLAPLPFYVPEGPQSDDCYFLSFVQLAAVGLTEAEQAHVGAAVRESGATRYHELCAAVTHIVVGSLPSSVELVAVREHQTERREEVPLVRLSWLYDSCNRRQFLAPEGHYAVSLAQLLQMPPSGVLPAQQQQVCGKGRV